MPSRAREPLVPAGDSAVWVVALFGLPVIAVMVAGAAMTAQMWLTSWHPGTCWDVLVVDLFELALAAQAPLRQFDLKRPEGSAFGLSDEMTQRVFDLGRRRLFLEQIEEVAGRTVTNFATVLRPFRFAGDPALSTSLAEQGAGIAAGIRAVKAIEVTPGATEESTVAKDLLRNKLTAAAQRRWGDLRAPGEFELRRRWPGPAARIALAAGLLVAAILAPVFLDEPTGPTLRSGLIAVAIAAVFSTPATTGQRTFDVVKTAAASE